MRRLLTGCVTVLVLLGGDPPGALAQTRGDTVDVVVRVLGALASAGPVIRATGSAALGHEPARAFSEAEVEPQHSDLCEENDRSVVRISLRGGGTRPLTDEERETLSVESPVSIRWSRFELEGGTARVLVDFLGCGGLGSATNTEGGTLLLPMYGNTYILEKLGVGWRVTDVQMAWIS